MLSVPLRSPANSTGDEQRIAQVRVGALNISYKSAGHELLCRDDFICKTQLNGILCRKPILGASMLANMQT